VTSRKFAKSRLRFVGKKRRTEKATGRVVAGVLARTLATQPEAKISIKGAQLALREISSLQKREPAKSMKVQLACASQLSIRGRQWIDGLQVPNGSRFPFRRSFMISVQEGAEDTRAWIEELAPLLEGRGDSVKAAIAELARRLDRLVDQHWRKPSHLLTPQDEAVNRILDNLIDWEAFRLLNPVEQPLWGKVVRWLPSNRIVVRWFLGPNEERDKETVLARKDICTPLLDIPIGHWFYGAGKVYPKRIWWTQLPVQVPDPSDRHAVEQAWDLIPRKVVAEAGVWPLREE